MAQPHKQSKSIKSKSESYGDGSNFTHYLGNDEFRQHSHHSEHGEENLSGKVAEGNEEMMDLETESEEKRHSGL